MSSLISLQFEIFGRVQGVFFRKYTQRKATELGLTGWVRNTSRGTVQGVAEGASARIQAMRSWLQQTGSPQSNIERAEFTESPITTKQFKNFKIGRTS